jgi:hypothetical protein
MDSSAIPIFMAGPFPVLYTSFINELENEVELDVALLIGGLPNMIAATRLPLDETWYRIEAALQSGDARLGVAGMPYRGESVTGVAEVYPSAYIGLECANGERLVLARIRGHDPNQEAEAYARDVIAAILKGHTPADLGEFIDV